MLIEQIREVINNFTNKLQKDTKIAFEIIKMGCYKDGNELILPYVDLRMQDIKTEAEMYEYIKSKPLKYNVKLERFKNDPFSIRFHIYD